MDQGDSQPGYGYVAIVLHWLSALAVFGLFGLGLWMVDLTYYDPWYNRGPALHKSIGMLLLGVTLVRLAWRWVRPGPEPEGRLRERQAAVFVHRTMLALLVASMVAGYLISTAKGDGIAIFGWFEVPATVHGFEGQGDLAGWAHEWLAYALIALAALHTAAALKHHFIDRDRTLLRMLRPGKSNGSRNQERSS